MPTSTNQCTWEYSGGTWTVIKTDCAIGNVCAIAPAGMTGAGKPATSATDVDFRAAVGLEAARLGRVVTLKPTSTDGDTYSMDCIAAPPVSK